MGAVNRWNLLLIVGVVVVVAGASIAGPGAADAGSEVVVDPSDGDTPDTIQDGITEASPGDTVVVKEGTYREAVVVDKSVTLVADGDVTVDGEGDDKSAFVVQNDSAADLNDVAIVGFRIENYGDSDDVEYDGHGIVVSNDDTSDQTYANVTIKDNTIRNVGESGVYLVNYDDDYSNVTLQNNTVSDFERAGLVVASKGDGATDGVALVNNTIEEPSGGDGIGVEVVTRQEATLVDVLVAGTNASGHWIGLDVTSFERSSVTALNVTHNEFDGNEFGFRSLAFDNSTVSDVDVQTNDFEGADAAGMRIWAKNDTELENLTVSENALNETGDGIGFELQGYNQTTVNDVELSRADLSSNDVAALVRFERSSSLSDLHVSEVLVDGSNSGIELAAHGNGTIEGARVTQSALEGTNPGTGLLVETHDFGTVDDVEATEILASDNEVGVGVEANDESRVGAVSLETVVLQNNSDGLVVDVAETAELESVTVRKSLLRDNTDDGEGAAVTVTETTPASAVSIQESLLLRNDAGVHNENKRENVDARFNYWGDSTGPSSDADEPLADPVTGKLADGDGDSVSEGKDGFSNVRFSPGVCGKTETRDEMIRPIPDETVEETVSREIRDRTISETVTVNVADCIGLSIWDRSALSFRVDTGNAATSVAIPTTFLETEEGDADIHRDELAAYNAGDKVKIDFEKRSGVDTTQFANEDAQLIIVRADLNEDPDTDVGELLEFDEDSDVEEIREFLRSSPDISLEGDRDTGEATAHVDGLEVVEVRDIGRLDNTGQTSVTFGPQESGQYVAVLATVETGDGFEKTDDDGLSFNVIEDTSTVVGVEHVAVQKTESTVTPESDVIEQGDDVDFEAASNLKTDGAVAHALVAYDKDAFEDQTIIVEDVDVDTAADTATILTISGTADDESFFIEAEVDDDGTIGNFTADEPFTDVDFTMTFVVDGDETQTLTLNQIGSGADLSEGEDTQYQYVHAAIDQSDLNTWSSDEGQITVAEDPDDGKDDDGKDDDGKDDDGKDDGDGEKDDPDDQPSGGVGSQPSDDDASVSVIPVDGGATANVRDASAGEAVDVDLEGSIAGDGVTIESLQLRLKYSNDRFRIELTNPSADELSGVPSLDSGDAIGYLRIDAYQLGDDLDDATVRFTVDADRLPNGADADDVSMFRFNDGEWQELETEHVGGDRFVAETPGFSPFAIGVTQSEIAVTDAAVSDSEIDAGESVEVTATLENDGSADGTFTAELEIDGEVVDSRDVEVPAGETREVTFEHRFEEAGTYELSVSGTVAGTVDVRADEDDTPTTTVTDEPTETPDEGGLSDSPGLLVVVVFVVIGLGGLGAYYYREERFPWEQ